jgi:hypothetical protein
MTGFDLLAERKIEEALARGDLDNLPGAGRPLDLDDDPLVPEDVRAAYRILKNSGFVPPEVDHIREIAELERLLVRQSEAEDAARVRAVKRLALLKTRIEQRYYDRVLERLAK